MHVPRCVTNLVTLSSIDHGRRAPQRHPKDLDSVNGMVTSNDSFTKRNPLSGAFADP